MPNTPASERKLKMLFGATTREYRQRIGITQQELADRADMQRTYLADIERGARNLALTNIARLAAALDVPPSKFFARMQQIAATAAAERTK